MTTKTFPYCPSCGRPFTPGVTWDNANSCRAFFLASHILDAPGLSAWELAKLTGLSYTDATRGLVKAREYDLFRIKKEEKESGGFRYRYFPHSDHVDRLEQFSVNLHAWEKWSGQYSQETEEEDDT